MARITTTATLVSCESSQYQGKEYHRCNLMFEDGGVIPLGVSQEVPGLPALLKQHKIGTDGKATLSVRQIKGTVYMDVCDFKPLNGKP
ncbi:MAG: hypothetical protein OEY86_14810 [Nitrospira sp.]|nr:hypothetical protein [Nitrospira sp.]